MMSELSDEASESELLACSLSMWYGLGQLVRPEELDVPLDLYTASSIGQYEVVKECVQRGDFDLNQPNCGGWTALMYASYIGHDTIVDLLLEAGVDVNLCTPEGQTSLMLASSCGNESVSYFLLQQGAKLEMKDSQGWTALFHCTSAGHQQMVRFLLDSGANANHREPFYGFTPLMEAAASGHEIIVQYLLNHGVKVAETDRSGATARTLAMKYGHMKIVGLIDHHTAPVPRAHNRGPGRYEDLSSSDESCSAPQRQRPVRKAKGPSIHEGPQALAKITAVGIGGRSQANSDQIPPHGYLTFNEGNDGNDTTFEGEDIRYRDVTSPINEQDVESNSSKDENACFANNTVLIRSSSSSSEGLAKALGVSGEASLESNEDSDHSKKVSSRKHTKNYIKAKSRHSECQQGHSPVASGIAAQPCMEVPQYAGPKDLAEFLDQIGCGKYLSVFEEQDVDLRIFLTLTETDLREVGITLFGPKRKMTSAIARWHSSTRPPSSALEQAYADRLEAEMQELAIQLHKRCEELELVKGQMSQEQELRAVAESCLMERDMVWKSVQMQLKDTCAVTKEAGALLEQIKACQEELPLCLKREQTASRVPESRAVAGMEGCDMPLRSQSLPELLKTLEECTRDMGKALSTVNQNLKKLQPPDKDKTKWPES
ncbi:ankyrin repeat and SAM domain-containing protein 3 [Rhinatrema bivittatum]|uniref:ankyrin repeat and SAM domain-containing protein 3 n=1 Tax=Rhinatrema bivittatum TaxID=194408 RepID=UPI0011263671|nr:ankyrin repeat and SAM domain-containing protein 3 [Rhinatrema bivittatum]